MSGCLTRLIRTFSKVVEVVIPDDNTVPLVVFWGALTVEQVIGHLVFANIAAVSCSLGRCLAWGGPNVTVPALIATNPFTGLTCWRLGLRASGSRNRFSGSLAMSYIACADYVLSPLV